MTRLCLRKVHVHHRHNEVLAAEHILDLNNLNNILMLPQFAALTGFTDEEIDTYLHPDIERLGRTMGVGYDEVR